MKLFLKIKNYFLCAVMWCIAMSTTFAQNVTITVNATQNKRLISPYIYGRNEGLEESVQYYKDAGLRFVRMNGGNNASAYNWRAKLDVHPDWYNNVYPSDWDVLAQRVIDNTPNNIQGMFAFQLLGRVASNGQHNFDDWSFNHSQYWEGHGQNLAGGGVPNTQAPGGKALVEGNIDLFSKPWPADSSVAILDYWFGTNGKGFNKNQFQYWSMDNEVDVWNGTHDWTMPTLITASAFMDRYIELAKKAKALYPGIKLCGPITTSEWQWYKWSNESIYVNGRYYPWIEYFIKRLGDEYKATGIKLVDVIDIHNYPYYNNDTESLQGHRIYYDETYDYPGSNGIKTSKGGWDDSLKKQYIFKRFNDWLNEHFGVNHGITPGVSEWSPGPSEPNLASVIYASHLGTFANNSVELFSPWNWFTGMWETLHLFSRNAKEYSVSSTSSLENTVSAYTTVNEAADSLTVIIVNRDMSSSRNVTVNLNGFSAANGSYKSLQLSSLPSTETFKSHTNNALKTSSVTVNVNSFTISVPALSTTAILLSGTPGTITGIEDHIEKKNLNIYPNPGFDKLLISIDSKREEPVVITVLDQWGRKIRSVQGHYDGVTPITLDISTISSGIYILSVSRASGVSQEKFVVAR
ncbi:MAG: glycoside hydrolase family 44 protein [Chryseolinea sp.]